MYLLIIIIIIVVITIGFTMEYNQKETFHSKYIDAVNIATY